MMLEKNNFDGVMKEQEDLINNLLADGVEDYEGDIEVEMRDLNLN